MKKAISETDRRRAIQRAYNEKHGIVPATIRKNLNLFDNSTHNGGPPAEGSVNEEIRAYEGAQLDLEDIIKDLEYKMKLAAETLEFEKAAEYRDKIRELKDINRFNQP